MLGTRSAVESLKVFTTSAHCSDGGLRQWPTASTDSLMDTKSSVGALHNVHVGTSLLHHSLLHFSSLHYIGTMVMVVVCQ